MENEKPALDKELMFASSATLCFVSPKYHLKAPVVVSILFYRDGTVYAHLYDALLFGEGVDPADAIDNLRENIITTMQLYEKHLKEGRRLGAPAARTRDALRALLAYEYPI